MMETLSVTPSAHALGASSSIRLARGVFLPLHCPGCCLPHSQQLQVSGCSPYSAQRTHPTALRRGALIGHESTEPSDLVPVSWGRGRGTFLSLAWESRGRGQLVVMQQVKVPLCDPVSTGPAGLALGGSGCSGTPGTCWALTRGWAPAVEPRP